MSAHNFGRRYISQRNFLSYAKHVGLPGSFLEQKLEFAERVGVIVPAARVRYPDSVVRRWYVDRYKDDVITESIEPDGPLLDAANALSKALADEQMYRNRFVGTGRHPLDAVAKAHLPFVTRRFSRKSFAPWSSFRTLVGTRDGHDLYDRDGVETYYHAWQVYPFAAFLRSGLTLLYDVFAREPLPTVLDLSRADLDLNQDRGAYHELRVIRDNAKLFDALGQFCELADRALQIHARQLAPNTRQLTESASRSLRAAESAAARRVARSSKIRPASLVKFIRLQCSLWSDAESRHSPRVRDEYKRSVEKSIEWLRLAFPRVSVPSLVKRVGYVGGWRRPVLHVMWPDWVEEQRRSVEPSLQQWIAPRLAQMPQPFTFSNAEVASFCTWIEDEGFLQLYWHFRRLTDIGPFDDRVGRTAAIAEVVGLASLVEHLVTHILAGRRPKPNRETLRGTLHPKLVELLRGHPTLRNDFGRNSALATTKKLPLRRQLMRIERARFVGTSAPVLKAFLRLVLIRNHVSHAGLRGYSRHEMQDLIESLLVASLVIWKAR